MFSIFVFLPKNLCVFAPLRLCVKIFFLIEKVLFIKYPRKPIKAASYFLEAVWKLNLLSAKHAKQMKKEIIFGFDPHFALLTCFAVNFLAD